MTPVVRLLVLAAALTALALIAATSLSARAARERAQAAQAASAQAASPRAARPGAAGVAGAPAKPSTSAAEAGDRRAARSSSGSRRAAPPEAARTRGRRSASTEPAPAWRLRIRSGRTVAIRSRPGGRVIGRLGSRTEFGSPRVLGATKTEGRWLGVATTVRSNGRLAWVDARSGALRAAPSTSSIGIDLSRRRAVLRSDGEITDRIPVAVGRPGSSTPTGRFAVTDKLDGRDFGPYYGCCVLALSGTQPNLPPGWTGGDRLAIHGTDDPDSIGLASSAGCPRAGKADMRKLMRSVPLGTPVEIRE